MAARGHSATSLQRYATAKQPDIDLFNGSTSRDYCNSFWGLSDAGPNIMFARMRGASKTTDELRNFWNERSIIEEEYANRLAKLAKAPIGGDEIGELRNSLDTLRIETEKLAESHLELAQQMRLDLEGPTAQFHQKQVNHRRTIQAPLERKFKEKQVQESYVKKSREKYEADCLRINSYAQQATYMQGSDLQKVQQKLIRTKQTMQGNERDFAKFTKELSEMLRTWEKEWKDFCDSCQDLEEERIDFMKDIIWAYANDISIVCVSDDQSCERIRTALDQLEPEKDVENFVNEYGTGNSIATPAEFTPSNGHLDPQLPDSPVIRAVDYQRVTRRAAPAYHSDAAALTNNHPTSTSTDASSTHRSTNDINGRTDSPYDDTLSYTSQKASPPITSPPNQPIPPVPEAASAVAASSSSSSRPTPATTTTPSPAVAPKSNHRDSLPMLPQNSTSRAPARSQTPPPPLPQQGNRILFYVKALYDYTATIHEEFDFQAGDVIAVTATPDDGWWSGELLDEARRVEGRNVFPSNFVCLF
ncbi:Septation protein imp2 [Psilocybe cubensis]|uniref:Septation protein imp2 n=2 Tax=Psilocybe cubensis TaxID=181762 RepID=A0A8H7Y843_PSICU|nr:Septation protein imp2 [Psilocybe cubensis]KAH9485613.1 Septation protein imp2 [Psilocybe cubensis]